MNAITDQCSRILVGLFFVCALFPFVSPLPIETDTQPLCLIFAAIVVGRRLLFGRVGLKAGILLLLSACSLAYINPFAEFNIELGKYVSLFSGVIVLVATSSLGPKNAYKITKVSILTYFVYSCLIYVDSGFFLGLQRYFVRSVNVDDASGLVYRGAPALATEPGLLGGLLVFIAIQLFYFAKLNGSPMRERNWYALIIVLTVFMTKSGTGYLYLVLLVLMVFLEGSSRKAPIMIFILGAVAVPLMYAAQVLQDLDVSNRGLEILVGVSSGRTFGEDTSVLKRIYDFAIGFLALADHPFGVGVNNVERYTNEVAYANGLLRDQDYGERISLVSGLSWFFLAYGFIGLTFIAYIFFRFSKASLLHKVFAFLFLSLSYSPAFPAIWILLAQPKARNEKIACRRSVVMPCGDKASSVSPFPTMQAIRK